MKSKYNIEVRLIYRNEDSPKTRVYAVADARFTKTMCVVDVSTIRMCKVSGMGGDPPLPFREGEMKFLLNGMRCAGARHSWRYVGIESEQGPMLAFEEEVEIGKKQAREYRSEMFRVEVQDQPKPDIYYPDAKILYVTFNGHQGSIHTLFTKDEMIKVRDALTTAIDNY